MTDPVLTLYIRTEEDFLHLATDFINWRGIASELGVKRAQAHSIMATFAPEDKAKVYMQIPGYDPRPMTYVRRAAFDSLARHRRGNPKFSSSEFQQRMANRRWHPATKGADEAEKADDEEPVRYYMI